MLRPGKEEKCGSRLPGLVFFGGAARAGSCVEILLRARRRPLCSPHHHRPLLAAAPPAAPALPSVDALFLCSASASSLAPRPPPPPLPTSTHPPVFRVSSPVSGRSTSSPPPPTGYSGKLSPTCAVSIRFALSGLSLSLSPVIILCFVVFVLSVRYL